jgi:hypothetical protein
LGIVGIGLVFLAIGVGLVNLARRTMKRSRASLSWPTVSGVVRASDVLTRVEQQARYDRASVLYQYVVGGTTYWSDTMSISAWEVAGDMQRARETVSKHPVGSQVRVYYDPDDPEAAVLDRSADAVRKAKIMALAMGLIGLGMALLGSFLAGR